MTDRPEILVGPLLRYVDSTEATVWVEVSAPCRVTIRAGEQELSEPSWGVFGHHSRCCTCVTCPKAPKPSMS
ncbi:hypothetical protein KB219_35325, partial [Pseudomonas aeruginosa]|nr:hypothetical protein [Pseudomonas aeruginosa]